jgi:hypothetical protein
MSNTTNISPVVSPDILKTISAATAIKTFGSQLKDKSKETTVVGNQTKTAELDSELDALTNKEKQAGINKNNTIQKAQSDFNTKQITQEQYNSIITSAQLSYEAEITAINIQKQKLQQDKNNIENNPYTIINNEQKVISNNIKNIKKETQNEENKSKKDLTKQIVSNIAKTLAPVLALQLANSFSTLISQRKKLEELVDQVNNYITTQVKDQTTVTIATNLRNNAITLINNNIKKLQNLEKILKTISTIVIVTTLVVTIIERILSLPIPALLPIKVQFQPKLQKILRLISALSALLVVATMLLSNEIIYLTELRNRLKEISLKLDGKILENLDDQQLSELSNEFLPAGGDYGSYKGFKFAIKEEQNPRFVVKGNKRRYAVAIDRYGVEIIKSEYSFTLDPNDLIEQLKLIIDQQNLQG